MRSIPERERDTDKMSIHRFWQRRLPWNHRYFLDVKNAILMSLELDKEIFVSKAGIYLTKA